MFRWCPRALHHALYVEQAFWTPGIVFSCMWVAATPCERQELGAPPAVGVVGGVGRTGPFPPCNSDSEVAAITTTVTTSDDWRHATYVIENFPGPGRVTLSGSVVVRSTGSASKASPLCTSFYSFVLTEEFE